METRHMSPQGSLLPQHAEPTLDPRRLAMRGVHRAISDLRRGTPVLITDGEVALLVGAAETLGAAGLADIAAAGLTAPILLLAPVRAAAVLRRPVTQAEDQAVVGLRLPASALEPARLRGFADPTAESLLPAEAEQISPPPLAGAALALAKLGRLLPALVVTPAMTGVAERLSLLRVPAENISTYPISAASSLKRVAEARVPLEDAPEARIIAFRAADGGIEHLAILVGDPEGSNDAGQPPLVRAHSECFTGDLLGSLRCDCGPQLRGAIKRMAEDRAGGVLLYLAQEGRGIGLVNKLRAYTLQDRGLDTLDANRALGYGADERNFLVAATMLREIGMTRVRLLTNNPDKLSGLAACGIEVVGREAHAFDPNGVNDAYLDTKARRFGHMLG
ncbi:MAG: GTP cyclohydrolase II [Roseomonas sp.]|nr:GTP cyclohydrolase II [Roseomonas sp.]MCA3379192.1 GTP cyclohydrolase II [Roseomonas sp.]